MKTVKGKLIMLGESGVGKTSLLIRYIEKSFDNMTKQTVGASFFNCCINLPNAKVKLEIWDTAGQERYKSMAPMYYRNANIAFLVFDITNFKSFITVKTWVNELKRSADEIALFVIIGNKNDLNDDRKVSYEEAYSYATSVDAVYHEVSVLMDDGVDLIFSNTAKRLLIVTSDDYKKSKNLKIHDLESSFNGKDGFQYPSKEESLSTSIAHGTAKKSFCC